MSKVYKFEPKPLTDDEQFVRNLKESYERMRKGMEEAERLEKKIDREANRIFWVIFIAATCYLVIEIAPQF